MPVPPLLDLCLFAVCKNLNGSEFINTLPDFLRQRLSVLFRQEKQFQDSIFNLNLSNCMCQDDEIKSISFLKNLKHLNISHCEKLTGIALSYFSPLSNLETLIMNHCSREIPMGLPFLISLTNIKHIEIGFCEVMDPVVPFLIGLKNLKHLNLMCNRLTDEGCSKLSSLTGLEYLCLSMNPLITDETLKALTTLTNLTALILNYCKLLTGAGITQLCKSLPKIQTIEMGGCDRALEEKKVRPLILLAEDSKVQARMISMVLNRYNFDVEVATNGEMALDMFRANPRYNLILMDVVMPVMDGLTCVKLIREYEASRGLPQTPIIIQSADTRESQRTVCLQAGCDDFVPKPLDKECISLAKDLMEARQRNPKSNQYKKTHDKERKSLDSRTGSSVQASPAHDNAMPDPILSSSASSLPLGGNITPINYGLAPFPPQGLPLNPYGLPPLNPLPMSFGLAPFSANIGLTSESLDANNASANSNSNGHNSTANNH